MRRRTSAGSIGLAVAVAAGVLGAGIAYAAAGDLDPTFSGDGKATVNFGGDDTFSSAADVAVAPNGDAILVGTTDAVAHPADTTSAIAVASVRPDGTLDPNFSGDGIATIERGVSAYGYAVAVQPDGKIVIGGTDRIESGKAFLDALRLNADGTPDASFGPGGFRSVDFGNVTGGRADIAVAPDGKIVLGGYMCSGSNCDYEIARFNAGGTPDTTFSGDGKNTFSFSADDGAYEIAVQPDGKIVMAGENDGDAMELIRVKADGDIDPSFGLGGKVVPALPQAHSAAYAVALQPDGRIVAAGYAGASVSQEDVAVVRLESSGALDSTFSDDGILVMDLGGADYDNAQGIAIQADGKIIAGGVGDASQELFAIRVDATGAVDTTFGGGDGVAAVGFASPYQYGGDVALQADGKILLSGVTDNNYDFAVARFDNDPGVTPPPPPTPTPPSGDGGDTTPPETTITKFPKDHSHKAKAKYRFESSEPSSIFECALDSKTFEPCGNGKVKYKHLDFGKHHFLVRATDPTGNTDPSPARDKFARKHKH